MHLVPNNSLIRSDKAEAFKQESVRDKYSQISRIITLCCRAGQGVL